MNQQTLSFGATKSVRAMDGDDLAAIANHAFRLGYRYGSIQVAPPGCEAVTTLVIAAPPGGAVPEHFLLGPVPLERAELLGLHPADRARP